MEHVSKVVCIFNVMFLKFNIVGFLNIVLECIPSL